MNAYFAVSKESNMLLYGNRQMPLCDSPNTGQKLLTQPLKPMNTAELRSLKQSNLNAYRALAAVAMTIGSTREFGSKDAKYYRCGAFRQAYTAVKAALVGYNGPFWLNEKYLLDFHKHDRKVGMLRPHERSRAARKEARRLGSK